MVMQGDFFFFKQQKKFRVDLCKEHVTTCSDVGLDSFSGLILFLCQPVFKCDFTATTLLYVHVQICIKKISGRKVIVDVEQ